MRKNDIIQEWEKKYNELKNNFDSYLSSKNNILDPNDLIKKDETITRLSNLIFNLYEHSKPLLVNVENKQESDDETDDTQEFNPTQNGNIINHNHIHDDDDDDDDDDELIETNYQPIIINNNNNPLINNENESTESSEMNEEEHKKKQNAYLKIEKTETSNQLQVPYVMKKSTSDISVDGDGVDERDDDMNIQFEKNDKRREKPPDIQHGKKRGSVSFNSNNNTNNNKTIVKKRRRSFVSSELGITLPLQVRISPPINENNVNNDKKIDDSLLHNNNDKSLNISPRSDIATPSPAPPPPDLPSSPLQNENNKNKNRYRHDIPKFNKSRQSTEDDDDSDSSTEE